MAASAERKAVIKNADMSEDMQVCCLLFFSVRLEKQMCPFNGGKFDCVSPFAAVAARCHRLRCRRIGEIQRGERSRCFYQEGV